MKNFAVIKDDKVINIIVADSQEIAEEATGYTCVESTPENPAQIGWGYTGDAFVEPEITE